MDYDKTPSGSEASAVSGFYFKGWYTDWGKASQKLITENRQLTATDIKISSDVYDYTYYAVFEPITLTISQTNMKPGDSAIYEVVQGSSVVAKVMLTGASDSVTLQAIPAGNYTVREVTGNWTWTYGNPNVTPSNGAIEVVAGEKKEVVFDYSGTYEGSCWLHSENHR